MKLNTKIYIAGHRGMVGSAIWRLLESNGFNNLIGQTSSQLDLRNQKAVDAFFNTTKPEIVIDAAAKVGGILANNNYPYRFIMDNLLIQNNLIQFAHHYNVEKFIFLGSSCIYPKLSQQPIKEEYLLTGPLEPTNEWYALAKISGVKICEAIRKEFGKDFVSLMPTNLYGPYDNFDLETSHVLPAMIRKFHDAKVNKKEKVVLWGSGNPMREFLHVSDLAYGILFAIENKLPESLYNIGTGIDISIKELANIIQKVVQFEGEINWDTAKPDGTPRKLMNNSKLQNLGWNHKIDLTEGIIQTYNWFLENQNGLKELKMN
jgi:GDP-L-fucose synthase